MHIWEFEAGAVQFVQTPFCENGTRVMKRPRSNYRSLFTGKYSGKHVDKMFENTKYVMNRT